ncbi:protocatechuate 3,4-dioxygenase [Litorilituus sediminis]|uniref:Protocatechuate 3,4-dioxygenase n=1 Tax=Litorilituus sediminis TaxID=718192 RepID=A0A4P6P9B0_9GAMM|nr:protocatechuate 3,4-dioxygenase [Litorilituus sediminis]QBG36107.1 protocatechuate 3,4-dioxygenase [Litorilituus sediminis]
MKADNRRAFLKKSLLGTLGAVVAGSVNAQTSTPRDAEGPFYPITPQKDKDADLTKVAGKSGTAKGTIIEIYGQVLDTNLQPIEGATIDLWQANSFGKYHHPHDNSDAPIDEHFQSWAIIQSGKEGKFRFKTVMPGAYPYQAEPEDQRTPHIHMKIGKHGYEPVLTQMYFPDQEQNKTDGLYQRKTAEQQAMMTAQYTDKANQFLYNIFLEKY